jgi:hypothetical protein
LTIDGFRPDRDEDGWRITNTADLEKLGLDNQEEVDIPKEVEVVPRLKGDVDALLELMADNLPPLVPIRPSNKARVSIIFGDASGKGFGTSVYMQGSPELELDLGIWTMTFSDISSSNVREALNICQGLEEMVVHGSLPPGTEVFVFTDNFVTERAFYQGN